MRAIIPRKAVDPLPRSGAAHRSQSEMRDEQREKRALRTRARKHKRFSHCSVDNALPDSRHAENAVVPEKDNHRAIDESPEK